MTDIEKPLFDKSLTTSDEWALPSPLFIFCGVLLFVVAYTASYEFITIMRWVVFVVFAWSSLIAWHNSRRVTSILLLTVALVFNPIVPIRLSREIWIVLDSMAGAFALIIAWLNRVKKPTESDRENFWNMLGFSVGLVGIFLGAYVGIWVMKSLELPSGLNGVIGGICCLAVFVLIIVGVQWVESRFRRK